MAIPQLSNSGAGYAAPSVQGGLPWGGSSGGAAIAAAAGGNIGAVGASYDQAYNNALAMNQSNYNNILAGYQQSLATQTTAQQAISAGYTDLYNNVLDQVKNVGQARANDINAASDRNLARGSQQLIDRGLGNTTVQSSVARGVEADRNARQLDLSESVARMTGDYMSRLGGDRLSNMERNASNVTGQTNRQLEWMNSLQAKYPDAGLYASLAQTAAEANRPVPSYGGGAFANDGRTTGGGVTRGPQDRLGYIPDRGPQYPSGGSNPGMSGGGGGGGGYGNVAGGIGSYINPGQNFGGYASGGGVYDTPAAGYSPGYDQPAATDPWNAGAALGDPYGDAGVDPYSLSTDQFTQPLDVYGDFSDWY